MKKSLGILLASLLVMPLLAQDEIEFRADNMVLDEQARTTELKGNAVLTRNGLSMKSDVIVIYTKVVGEEEVFDHMVGTGNVEAKSGDQIITADKMIYTANNETAIFTGDVVVKKGKNIARANKAVLNAATGIYTLSGPVKGTISGKLP